MSNGLYLYGIVPAPASDLALQGLDQQPVQTQQVDDFVFLYSEAQQSRYLASRRNLLGHERVLEQAMEAGFEPILPLQFGLTIDTWQTVREQLLESKSDRLFQLFDKLSGRREVSIKLFWEPQSELEMLLAEDEKLRCDRDALKGKTLSMDETIRIGQAIERALQIRQQQIIQAFQEKLNSIAIEVVENDLLSETMIYNCAYLIPGEVEPQFSELVEQLDEQFDRRLRIRYNNFTAPFNFAQLN